MSAMSAVASVPDTLMEWSSDSVLHLRFPVTAGVGKLKSDYRVKVTPTVSDTAGTSVPLSEASFEGRRYTRYADRLSVLNRDSLRRMPVRRVADTVYYDTTVVVPPSMRGECVSLSLERYLEGCCRTKPMESLRIDSLPCGEALAQAVKPDTVPAEPVSDTLLAEREPLPVPVPVVPEEEEPVEPPLPENAYVKHISQYTPYDPSQPLPVDSASMFVQFKVDKDNVDTAFRNNAVYLETIRRMVDRVMTDTTIRLAKIVIIGSASVDGEEPYNIQLAERRAKALRRYVEEHFGLKGVEFEMVNAGEAWADLKLALQNTPLEKLPERDALIEIIDTTDDNDERERKMRAYRGGAPWWYVYHNILPDQRTAGYVQVYYDGASTDGGSTEVDSNNKIVSDVE